MLLRHKYSKREEALIIREATVTLREIGVAIMEGFVNAQMKRVNKNNLSNDRSMSSSVRAINLSDNLQAKPQVAIVKVDVPEKEQQESLEPETSKQLASTERELEHDPHHIVLSSPIPTAEDRKKTGSEITKLEW